VRDLTITRGAARAVAVLFILVLFSGAGNLWASWTEVHNAQAQQRHEQVLQQQAGVALEQKLCSTFGAIAELKPPAGNPETNPSRAYDQQLHAVLVQLGLDLGCKKG
jgi:hypothetical protein